MYNLRGIAWDDEPNDFMAKLQAELRSTYRIDLEIYDDRALFNQAFAGGSSWDFTILDVFDERGGTVEDVGVALAHLVAEKTRRDPWYPIILITHEIELLTPTQTSRLPANASIRYKEEPDWVAHYIHEELQHRGVIVDRQRVFHIGNSAPEVFARYGSKVQQRLRTRNLVPLTVGTASPLSSEIAAGLLQRMNECAAIVAVCTPDDVWTDGSKHPRQNVLLEIGMAMGLSRGLQRLTILKHEEATLPSDLGGILTINFDNDIATTFPSLETHLMDLGLRLA